MASFPAGERVLEEGHLDSTFYMILTGRADIQRAGVDRPVGVVGAGECLGEMSLLTAQPHSASAVATSPIEAATLSHADLTELIRFRPDIGVTIYRNLAAGLGAKLARTSS